MNEEPTAREAFVEQLHQGLQHLYDPTELRNNPLIACFALEESHDPLAALRRHLTGGIRALKPADSVPLHTKAWRVYHILTYRYMEQLSQKEVATDLALSVRQLRRQEKAAVKVLADYLLAHHEVRIEASLAPPSPTQEAVEGQADQAQPPDRENELAWLEESLPSEIIDIGTVIEAACRTIRPLTERSGIQIDCHMAEDVPPVTGQRAAIRQALLNLLTAATTTTGVSPSAEEGVQLTVEVDGEQVTVHIRVSGSGTGPSSAMAGDVVEKLSMTRQLVAPFGGALEIQPVAPDRPFAVTLTLQASQTVPVLVIDDNADALKLLARYLSGTRYRFTGVRDPEEALTVAEEVAPHIIVMDVMLPDIDGWELLGRFREHPSTRDVPIITCTILPQEQLALTLGAAGFLRKPFSREAFLTALEHQVAPSWRESR